MTRCIYSITLQKMLYNPTFKGRMLLCDDHILFCEGLKNLISVAFPNLNIQICNDAATAEKYIQENELTAFICDIKIKDESGIDLIRRNRIQLGNCIVVVLSGYYDTYMLQKAKQAGANYFLKKEVGSEELFTAISNVHPNKLEHWENAELNKSKSNVLSKQEIEIVILIADGLRSKEIAERLFISKSTVDTHRKNIHRKLNTTNTAELIKWSNENRQ